MPNSDNEEILETEVAMEVDSQISQLRHQRGIIKGKLTRFEKFLGENKQKSSQYPQLETRLGVIEKELLKFDEIQSQLEFLDIGESEEREDIECKFYEVISGAKTIISAHDQSLSSNISSRSIAGSVPLPVVAPITQIPRLPDMGLPTFSGTYETWLSFFDVFNSVVNLRTDLSDIQKFLYLKTCCRDDALRMISSLEVTTENYSVALELLKKRFENKRAIINHHVNGLLFNLPDASKESHFGLRKLIDSVYQHKNALLKLQLPANQWDALLIPLILRKLDDRTRREWGNKQDEFENLPTLDKLIDFLTKKCFLLESNYQENMKGTTKYTNNNNYANKNVRDSKTLSKPPVYQNYASTELPRNINCQLCNDSHFIFQCKKYLDLPIKDKYEKIKLLKLCSNCLRPGHLKYDCKSSSCKRCGSKHNTTLHSESPNTRNNNDLKTNQNVSGSRNLQKTQSTSEASEISEGSGSQLPDSQNFHTNMFETFLTTNEVLLSTAKILIEDSFGKFHTCNALLDSGSQSNIITQSLCDKLKLKLTNVEITVGGINQTISNIKHKTYTTIKSRFNTFETSLSFLVMPTISNYLPLQEFSRNIVKYPQNINLADESFNEPKSIDVLLGARIFYELLGRNKINLGKDMPVLVETKLGWIFTGTLKITYGKTKEQQNRNICNLHYSQSDENLNKSLSKFWELEELPKKKFLSPEDTFCENYFSETTSREGNRFVVRLPFKKNMLVLLGESQASCLKRFNTLEYRLSQNECLKNEYVDFLREYEILDHMELKGTLDTKKKGENSYFLPHHPVIKPTSSTTKVRVVFDASSKTETGYSLNDILHPGPVVQDELFAIILRLRLRRVILSADIKMMFRQILIHPQDSSYQQILWREDVNQPIDVYQLKTVTYGTSCAPFLATRCLKQLAIENKIKFPKTSSIIENSFYMDDLLVSLNSLDEAIAVYSEITKILAEGGFILRKWSSNDSRILEHILKHDQSRDQNLIAVNGSKEIKTLGILWNPSTDCLKYSVQLAVSDSQVMTKRMVLSLISQIYDPLGLISPVLITAKLLLQELFKLEIGWDDRIPEDKEKSFLEFLSQLPVLNEIDIKRQVVLSSAENITLCGFADASERAYGACIYLVSKNTEGQSHSQFLCAKSKVLPIRKITLPRAELLAAHLLSRLTHTVKNVLDIEIAETFLFSDSTIVLSWLKIDPSRLKTFVANRVAQINELTNIKDWKHVRSEQNAADIISRGIEPKDLHLNQWWHGPTFLTENLHMFNSEPLPLQNLPEIKNTSLTLLNMNRYNFDRFKNFSDFNKLQNVMCYVLRFRNRLMKRNYSFSKNLTLSEQKDAHILLIKIAQASAFSEEINLLQKSCPLNKGSKILSLHPFLDNDGLVRVGGRLFNSELNFEQKHPLILPDKHKITELIIERAHVKHLHAGVQLLLSVLRLEYWPVNGKNAIKRVIKTCIQCFKANPKTPQYLMGELPSARVTKPERAFSQCGVDYAGPILVKEVKAVHIELVKDLSTASFLNALKRFISRRGKPRDIFSDNGANFSGANNYFIELHNLISNESHRNGIVQFLATEKINWHFNPANSPHMGGLWESAVKSTKFHLRRILGNAAVTYEELYTLLTQIEACLNSRPLTPISNDPTDLLPLTPAHFLIGDSLQALPQLDVTASSSNRLTRYDRLQQLFQQFWRRWSQDYLSQLQTRNKWKNTTNNIIKVDSLVILKEDNVSPLHWPMARIVKIHPGPDGVIRVVSVRTASGRILKRSTARICVLPID